MPRRQSISTHDSPISRDVPSSVGGVTNETLVQAKNLPGLGSSSQSQARVAVVSNEWAAFIEIPSPTIHGYLIADLLIDVLTLPSPFFVKGC